MRQFRLFVYAFITTVLIAGAMMMGSGALMVGCGGGESSSGSNTSSNNNHATVSANNNVRNCANVGQSCNVNGGPECCETGRSCFRANPNSTAGVCM